MKKARDSSDRKSITAAAKRVVVKIGSGVLTSEQGLDLRVIGRLTDEISLLKEGGRQIVIVSSGAIAAGVKKMSRADRPKAMPEQQAAAAIGQCSLVLAYEDAFARYGARVAQILLTLDDMVNRKRYLNARNTLLTLLEWGVIPIVNENDTVAVEEIAFGDNDHLSAMIVNLAEADLLVNLSSVDGLFEADPQRDKAARLIKVVKEVDARTERLASASPGEFGRGGMLSKLQAARKVALAGVPTIIANGKKPQVLTDIFEGKEVGTLVLPARKRLAARKRWIASTLVPRGEIVVDAGARKVLLEDGKSLLASGIIEVRGKFGLGAPVRCVDEAGFEVGIGLVNYSSADLDKIKGLKSSEIEERLGYKYYDEVIHRDNLVILER